MFLASLKDPSSSIQNYHLLFASDAGLFGQTKNRIKIVEYTQYLNSGFADSISFLCAIESLSCGDVNGAEYFSKPNPNKERFSSHSNRSYLPRHRTVFSNHQLIVLKLSLFHQLLLSSILLH